MHVDTGTRMLFRLFSALPKLILDNSVCTRAYWRCSKQLLNETIKTIYLYMDGIAVTAIGGRETNNLVRETTLALLLYNGVSDSRPVPSHVRWRLPVLYLHRLYFQKWWVFFTAYVTQVGSDFTWLFFAQLFLFVLRYYFVYFA